MKKTLFAILLCGVIVLGLTGCGKSSINDAKKDLQESQEKYGSVEKETVDVLAAKFNTEVVDNSTLNPASTDYLTEYNNQYWYGLFDGVSLVVVPKTYTGDKATDIVDYMLIYVDKTSKYSDDALTYAKYLIKANCDEVTETEINTLLEEAKTKSTTGETAYNGKGISVGYLDGNDYYQYQVLRFYK
jgi:hypothetical protein